MPERVPRLKQTVSVDSRTLLWFLGFRLLVITLLLGGTTGLFLNMRSGLDPRPLFLLIALAFLQTLVSLVWLRWLKTYSVYAQVQVVWDLLFVTALILLTGGSESIFSFAYLLVIVAASFLLSRKQTIFAAACATILYGGVLDLQAFGYLVWLKLYPTESLSSALTTAFVHVFAFFLTAILSGTLANRWRQSEAELQKRSIDYDELEKLNRMILGHISSGLMIVNRQGHIRSFNRAAAQITGYQLEDVYDKDAAEIFPGFKLFSDQGYNLVSRTEGAFEAKDGRMLVLGYATKMTKDRHGYDAGLLVTFQDLTQLKIAEEQLQRADRLAAVGRLASGMAHEIRNPLASISGSVQLLMENAEVGKDDHRLMGIVVKEAERLSQLLTDFLTFARPRSPVIEQVNITQVLDEVLHLMHMDERFMAVEIIRDYPQDVHLWLDPTQIRQVLWDLAVNAVEAMADKGKISFGLQPAGVLTVEDSGPGVPPEVRKRIFDPFFSTKEKGTGMGLATVYAIVEAHGGTVQVGQGELGGAMFRLNFEAVQGVDHG